MMSHYYVFAIDKNFNKLGKLLSKLWYIKLIREKKDLISL